MGLTSIVKAIYKKLKFTKGSHFNSQWNWIAKMEKTKAYIDLGKIQIKQNSMAILKFWNCLKNLRKSLG